MKVDNQTRCTVNFYSYDKYRLLNNGSWVTFAQIAEESFNSYNFDLNYNYNKQYSIKKEPFVIVNRTKLSIGDLLQNYTGNYRQGKFSDDRIKYWFGFDNIIKSIWKRDIRFIGFDLSSRSSINLEKNYYTLPENIKLSFEDLTDLNISLNYNKTTVLMDLQNFTFRSNITFDPLDSFNSSLEDGYVLNNSETYTLVNEVSQCQIGRINTETTNPRRARCAIDWNISSIPTQVNITAINFTGYWNAVGTGNNAVTLIKQMEQQIGDYPNNNSGRRDLFDQMHNGSLYNSKTVSAGFNNFNMKDALHTNYGVYDSLVNNSGLFSMGIYSSLGENSSLAFQVSAKMAMQEESIQIRRPVLTIEYTILDDTPPDVTALIPVNQSYFNSSKPIEIAANVTDNLAVDTVYVLGDHNGFIFQINLTLVDAPKYNTTFAIPGLNGTFNLTFIANDTANNVNNTETTQFYGIRGSSWEIAVIVGLILTLNTSFYIIMCRRYNNDKGKKRHFI